MSDQIADRRAKLEKIRAEGADPYGERFTDVTRNADIRAAAERTTIQAGQILEGPEATFKAAGRIVLYRNIGSLIFMTVRDWTGELQFGLSKKMVADELDWKVAKLLDLGDIIGAEGRLGRTKTGELTLWASRLRLLSKALRPPPGKWHGLTDVEARYRRRHVDLYSNPDSQKVFVQRARIIDYARDVLRRRGFIEVDTPVLQPIYGGAAARPFTTHHNTLDMDLFLRISPEMYLKRCLVGGLERVFEFSRCFRNEGISPRHNPEFTMLELYQAYGDYHDMMEITEEIIGGAARDVIGATKIKFGETEIDYATPWPRRKYADLFAEHVGFPLDDIGRVRARARELKIEEGKLDDAVVVNALFEHHVEPQLVNPVFVLDYPAPLCPLTKRDPNDPNLALRFEVFIHGMELGNAYSELNDPDLQRQTLGKQLRGEEDETMAIMDEEFVEALECGMPPAGGLGIGIDRLVMLLTGSTSIRDVILFPLQRPKELEEAAPSRTKGQLPKPDELEVRAWELAPSVGRPHVVLLGAGASLAAVPDGDKGCRKLPLLDNIVQVLELEPVLLDAGIDRGHEDFEALYSRLRQDDRYHEVVSTIEERVFDYFAALELPERPTLYDHLVLSLRPKDVIATFNWDPFLWQALCRNNKYAPMPQALYLHGNAAIGYCGEHKPATMGARGRRCGQCRKQLEPSRLLYPVTQKNYNSDPMIALAWRAIQASLKEAFVFTVFGYSAPSTDVEAVTLLSRGWGLAEQREFEEIEIIDVKPEDGLRQTWKPFIHTHHYQCFDNFYDSTLGVAPRRTCEAMWAQLMECKFVEPNRIPRDSTWDRLRQWIHPLIEQEEIQSARI